MATAFALPEASTSSFASLWHALPPAPLRCLDSARVEAGVLVHIIHPDEDEAAGMVRSCAPAGVRTRVHQNAAAFARSEAVNAPGCLIFHVRFARAGVREPTDDFSMPQTSMPMIVTADRADVRAAVLAMKAGAIDFFEAPICGHELGEAVERAIRADRARRETETRHDAVLARFATLTRREREVMGLVTQGLLNKQVAGDLGLSEITVKVHRGSVMRKMGTRTLAQLVRMADMLVSGAAPCG